MSEKPTPPFETAQQEHSPEQYTNISIEPGNHIMTDKDTTDLYKRLETDWYSAHVWINPQLFERLGQESPQVVTIDSLVPASTIKDVSPERHKTNLWIMLPGSPMAINREGIVSIVAADFIPPHWEEHSGIPDLAHIADRLNVEGTLDEIKYKSTLAIPMAGVPALLLRTFLDLKELQQRNTPNSEGSTGDTPSKISRRKFLKGALTTIGGLGMASLLPQILRDYSQTYAAYASSTAEKEFLLKLADLTYDMGFRLSEVDARTSLLHLKTREAMARANLSTETKASIVVGSNHSGEANDILRSDAIAKQHITHYVERLANITSDVLKDHSPEDRNAVMATIIDMLAATEVYSVREPPPPTEDGHTRDPQGLYDSIEITDSFKSPTVLSIANEVLSKRGLV